MRRRHDSYSGTGVRFDHAHSQPRTGRDVPGSNRSVLAASLASCGAPSCAMRRALPRRARDQGAPGEGANRSHLGSPRVGVACNMLVPRECARAQPTLCCCNAPIHTDFRRPSISMGWSCSSVLGCLTYYFPSQTVSRSQGWLCAGFHMGSHIFPGAKHAGKPFKDSRCPAPRDV